MVLGGYYLWILCLQTNHPRLTFSLFNPISTELTFMIAFSLYLGKLDLCNPKIILNIYFGLGTRLYR